MDLLKIFYDNELEREAVRDFILSTLNEFALEELFKGNNAIPVAKAKKVVDMAFVRLTELYKPKIKVSIKNKAR
jgi:hypothetical protein